MKFMEAIKEMEKGNILKHNDKLYKFNKEATCSAEDFLVKYKLLHGWRPTIFSLYDIKATDWEVVEETLWDKRSRGLNVIQHSFIENDVKEFINKYVTLLINEESYGRMVNFQERVENAAKEIFGEELLR